MTQHPQAPVGATTHRSPVPARRGARASLALGTLVAVLCGACADDAPHTAPTEPLAAPAFGVNNGENNRRILFESNRYDTLSMAIFSMNPDGSGVTQLTGGPGGSAQPAWSPDGKRVAFISTRHDSAGSEIYVMNADGAGVSRLTNRAGWDFTPTWSKDGKRIAFASTRDAADPTRSDLEGTDIYVMNADGTGVTRLTSTVGPDFDPSWSPDGKQMAFVSGRDFYPDTAAARRTELYVMNVDGSRVTRLTHEEGFASSPSWAPGGKQLALDVTSLLSPAHPAVYSVNADGTQLTRLTSGSYFGGDSGPSWSPDGKQLAFVSARDGNMEIYRMNADGTGQTRLTSTKLASLEPAWNR